MNVCEYGCGKEAKYKVGKKQRWCCSETFHLCPTVKEKKRFAVNGNNVKTSCEFCGKVVPVTGIKQHEKFCHSNPKNIIVKQCEYCGKNHDGFYGGGRFCSAKCAHKFSASVNKAEANAKISKTLTGRPSLCRGKNFVEPKVVNCEWCGKKFKQKKGVQRFCSRYCARKNNNAIRTLVSVQKIKENVANGTHKGWQARNILSYPEKFFRRVLKNNGLFDKCVVNYTLKKSLLGLNDASSYFLDFYFPELNLDFEVDGK